MSNGSRRSGACVRCCLVAFAVASALCVSGPALYWRLKKGFKVGSAAPPSSCPPCVCDCPPPLSLQKIAPDTCTWDGHRTVLAGSFIYIGGGLTNLSVPDCGKHDPDLNREMEKQFVDLLTEELKLQEAVAETQSHHMNYTLVEARRLASQYQKEAEKCNAATETCEEARERAEASLLREKKVTLMWEHRARQVGWQGQ